MTMPETAARHASWLELFFDLVVVVAVYQLAHLLHGDAQHGPGGLAIVTFFALYLAVWLLWTNFTLYSNVVAGGVRVPAMFIGMAGIATMAAAVPHGIGGRADVFAAAYVITSVVGSNALERSGMVLLSWMAASRNAGLVPWIVSFWVDGPWWKLGLWLLGITLTVAASVAAGLGDHDDMIARMNESARRRGSRARKSRWREIVAAQLDTEHLGERLGLFVIIVLGEAMLQVVRAVAAIEEWWPGSGAGWLLLLAVVSAFVLLIALWGLNVRHGFAEETRLRPALVLPAHFLLVASTTTVAAGLGVAAARPAGQLNPSSTWLMCAGTSVFLLVITLLVTHARRWPLRAAAVAVPLVAAVVAPWLPAAVLVAVLAVAAGGQLAVLSTSRPGKRAGTLVAG